MSRPPTSQPSPIIVKKPLEETTHPDQKNKHAFMMSLNYFKRTTCLLRLSCHSSLRLWPPTYFLPIFLHLFFCFCHNLLRLPCVILLIPTFPFHFVFPTGSLKTWVVIGDWVYNIICTGAAWLYQWRRWPPDDLRIVSVINFEPADVDCVVDCHVV